MVRGREEFKSHKKVTIIAEPKLRREKLKMHEGEIEGTKIISKGKGKRKEESLQDLQEERATLEISMRMC